MKTIELYPATEREAKTTIISFYKTPSAERMRELAKDESVIFLL